MSGILLDVAAAATIWSVVLLTLSAYKKTSHWLMASDSGIYICPFSLVAH